VVKNVIRIAWILLTGAPVLLAANKDMVRLQREMAILEDRVKTYQSTVDGDMGELKVLLQRTLDLVNDRYTGSARIEQRLGEHEQTLSVSIRSLGVNVAQMAAELRATRESLLDLTGRLKHLEQKIAEMDESVRVLQTPRPPPPSASESLGGPPAGVTASGLYQSAIRDRLAGKVDLALQEFRDYLPYFGNTELAAGSEYYIGEIAYSKGDQDAAIRAFDIVLEQYPKSGRAPDALYLKAKALESQGEGAAADNARKRLLCDYPNSDAANHTQGRSSRPRT
jgi:TolA-binding protein